MASQDRDSTNDSAAVSVTTTSSPGGPSSAPASDVLTAERDAHAGAIATAILASLAGIARPERAGVDWVERGIGPAHVAELEALARAVVVALRRIVDRAGGLVVGEAARDRVLTNAIHAAYTFGEAIAADHVPGATRETASLIAARDAWRAYAAALEPFAFLPWDLRSIDGVATFVVTGGAPPFGPLHVAAKRLRELGEPIDAQGVQL